MPKIYVRVLKFKGRNDFSSTFLILLHPSVIESAEVFLFLLFIDFNINSILVANSFFDSESLFPQKSAAFHFLARSQIDILHFM
jgi:hypothetical protein